MFVLWKSSIASLGRAEQPGDGWPQRVVGREKGQAGAGLGGGLVVAAQEEQCVAQRAVGLGEPGVGLEGSAQERLGDTVGLNSSSVPDVI